MCLFLGVLNHPVQPPFSFGLVDLAASLHQQVVGVEAVSYTHLTLPTMPDV